MIAGRHRLEACKQLLHPYIPARIIRCSDVQAELLEVTENLHRADLTTEARDAAIRRYAELLEHMSNWKTKRRRSASVAAKAKVDPKGL